MIIACKMTECPYYDNRGYCAKPILVSIDQWGMCRTIWRKSQRRPLIMPFSNENYPKEEIKIIDGEVKELVEKEEKAEIVQTSLKDLQNDAAAFV